MTGDVGSRDRPDVDGALAQRTRRVVAEVDVPAVAGNIPRQVLVAVRQALLDGETHYTSRPGLPELRLRLAKEVARLGGPSYDPDASVVVTSGAREALYVTLQALGVGPGRVLVTSSESARPVLDGGLWGLMELAVEPSIPSARATPETRLAYREWPGSRDAHDALRALAAEADLPDVLVVRDMGHRAVQPASDAFPPLTLDRTILIGSLDALPGVETFGLGFVAGPPPALAKIRTWKQALSICTPAPSQRAGLAALETWGVGG